jgi:hypothetical protein
MRQTSRRLGGAVLAALLLGALSGCVHQRVHDDTVTYTNEWWLAGATVLGAVVAGTVGSARAIQEETCATPLLQSRVRVSFTACPGAAPRP